MPGSRPVLPNIAPLPHTENTRENYYVIASPTMEIPNTMSFSHLLKRDDESYESVSDYTPAPRKHLFNYTLQKTAMQM